MRYGYFDEEKKEYVITRPDTPAPWVNYLGSPEYGAIVSNNAGGYSFAKSGANGRILRYIFNQFDQPGRYIYLRDNDTKDYWSASWQPVGKDLSEYKSECHHGTAYTKMMADYSEIHSEVNSIVLPIMKPAIAVQAIFTFVGSWNNYFVPALVIQSKSKMTVPILIATLRGADYMNFDMGKIYMMITVAIVPIIIVYLLLSKFIIAGVTLGGVKE